MEKTVKKFRGDGDDDDECVLFFLKRFNFVKVLNRKNGNVTILVGDAMVENNYVVIKIQSYGAFSKTESLVLSALNSLRSKTSVFTHIFGTFVCTKIPDEWNGAIVLDAFPDVIELAGPFVFFVEEYVPLKYTEIPPEKRTSADIKGYLFILIHGLMETRKKFPDFKLRDITLDNIMFQKRVSSSSLKFVLHGSNYEIAELEYFPKFVYYGRATLNNIFDASIEYKNEEYGYILNEKGQMTVLPSNDLLRLFFYLPYMIAGGVASITTFDKTFWGSYMDRIMKSRETYYTSGHKVFEDILSSAIFRLNSNITFKEKSIDTPYCQICMAYPAKAKYSYPETKDCFLFCSNTCEQRIRSIRQILPIK